mmetsp:Transcript_5234/g.15130  ORF Transcript_5234/g.15130 Transcript_5234/m.15130 type:complete len:261 (-) Transcript_5234:1173-1955(-)
MGAHTRSHPRSHRRTHQAAAAAAEGKRRRPRPGFSTPPPLYRRQPPPLHPGPLSGRLRRRYRLLPRIDLPSARRLRTGAGMSILRSGQRQGEQLHGERRGDGLLRISAHARAHRRSDGGVARHRRAHRQSESESHGGSDHGGTHRNSHGRSHRLSYPRTHFVAHDPPPLSPLGLERRDRPLALRERLRLRLRLRRRIGLSPTFRGRYDSTRMLRPSRLGIGKFRGRLLHRATVSDIERQIGNERRTVGSVRGGLRLRFRL